jgi:hypothetical protein
MRKGAYICPYRDWETIGKSSLSEAHTAWSGPERGHEHGQHLRPEYPDRTTTSCVSDPYGPLSAYGCRERARLFAPNARANPPDHPDRIDRLRGRTSDDGAEHPTSNRSRRTT